MLSFKFNRIFILFSTYTALADVSTHTALTDGGSQQQNQQLNDSLVQCQQQSQNLEQQCNQNLSQFQQELQETQAAYQKCEQVTTTVRKETTECNEKLGQADGMIGGRDFDIETLQTKTTKLEQEIVDMDGNMKKMGGNMKMMEQSLDESKSEYTKLQTEYMAFKSEFDAQKALDEKTKAVPMEFTLLKPVQTTITDVEEKMMGVYNTFKYQSDVTYLKPFMNEFQLYFHSLYINLSNVSVTQFDLFRTTATTQGILFYVMVTDMYNQHLHAYVMVMYTEGTNLYNQYLASENIEMMVNQFEQNMPKLRSLYTEMESYMENQSTEIMGMLEKHSKLVMKTLGQCCGMFDKLAKFDFKQPLSMKFLNNEVVFQRGVIDIFSYFIVFMVLSYTFLSVIRVFFRFFFFTSKFLFCICRFFFVTILRKIVIGVMLLIAMIFKIGMFLCKLALCCGCCGYCFRRNKLTVGTKLHIQNQGKLKGNNLNNNAPVQVKGSTPNKPKTKPEASGKKKR